MERRRDSGTHGGHRARMRQRVRSEGFEGLEPHELIEFLLFYAIPRQDVNELAHRLIERFGSVRGVLEAAPDELARVDGVGTRTARWLALTGEAVFACARLGAEERPMLRNCMDAFRFAVRTQRELTPPCCVQLCLDPAGRLLYRRTLCPSLSWGEPDSLREGLHDMLAAQAHSAILLLLTDGRAPEPDGYDTAHAAGYADTLRAADCELLDVILLGGDQLSSMRGSGLLPAAGTSGVIRALHEDYLQNLPAGTLRTQNLREDD